MISWKFAKIKGLEHVPIPRALNNFLSPQGVGSVTAEVIGVRQLAPYGREEGKFFQSKTSF